MRAEEHVRRPTTFQPRARPLTNWFQIKVTNWCQRDMRAFFVCHEIIENPTLGIGLDSGRQHHAGLRSPDLPCVKMHHSTCSAAASALPHGVVPCCQLHMRSRITNAGPTTAKMARLPINNRIGYTSRYTMPSFPVFVRFSFGTIITLIVKQPCISDWVQPPNPTSNDV